MQTISRDNFFQVFQDYLDYRYGPHTMGNMMITSSRILTSCMTPRSQDAELEKWIYDEECGGRVMTSQDGLTVGITEAGREAYTKISSFYRREYP